MARWSFLTFAVLASATVFVSAAPASQGRAYTLVSRETGTSDVYLDARALTQAQVNQINDQYNALTVEISTVKAAIKRLGNKDPLTVSSLQQNIKKFEQTQRNITKGLAYDAVRSRWYEPGGANSGKKAPSKKIKRAILEYLLDELD